MNQKHTTLFSTIFACLAVQLGILGPGAVLAQEDFLLQPHHRFAAAIERGDLTAAIEYARQVLDLAEQQYGEGSMEVVGPLKSLGEVLVQTGNFTEAVQYFQRAAAIIENEFGPDHPELVETLEALVNLRWQQEHFSEAESLLIRILGIEQSTYGESHKNVVVTWNRLRTLYLLLEKPDDVLRVDTALALLDTHSRNLDLAGPDAAPSLDSRRYNANAGFAMVRVFYGTNRARSGNSKASQFYGPERGDLELGYLDVSIPKSHKYGELETSSRWSVFSYGLGEDALKNKYVLLLGVEPLDQESFYGQLREHVHNSPTNDIFVFVHGYNSSFSDAARRTAQLAYDLDFDGTPMMYSWPSQASATAYSVDEAAVRVSGRKMAKFLRVIAEQANADRIHVIAHSMGNRALIEALETFVAGRSPLEPAQVFDQIIFTAPDVDRDYFVDVIGDIKSIAKRITLYVSENDYALQTSASLHGAPRAGLAGESIITVDGLDTIDMSEVEADMLGHSYFAANEGAINDLLNLLWKGDPPQQRCGMSSRSQDEVEFWLFDVSNCKGNAILEAGLLIKRFGRSARERVRRRLGTLSADADATAREEWSRILDRMDKLLNRDED